MKLLFTLEDQVHIFKIEGDLETQDLAVLRAGIFRFFESNPSFNIIDLSEATIKVSDFELKRTLSEIESLASSKNLQLAIATTSQQASVAKQKVLEAALIKQVTLLEQKLELREKMLEQAEALRRENESLKHSVSQKREELNSLEKRTVFSPIAERFWNEK